MTLKTNKKKVFLDQATLTSNLAKAKALKLQVDKFFNLIQFVDFFGITSDLQDSIGNVTDFKMSKYEQELHQTLKVWGRSKNGMNQQTVGLEPCENTIYLGGKAELARHTLYHYRTELVRDIDIMFELKEQYHQLMQKVLGQLILNLENLEKSK